MKLTDVLGEGKYGPGTRAKIKAPKPWTVMMNAIENKRRPEALFITMSVWVKPELSISVAGSGQDAQTAAKKAMIEFNNELKRFSPKIKNFFDDLYFDTESVIFIYDFAPMGAIPGKAQFIELEINIDTVNEIDDDDENPAPNPKTGKIENLHFDQFKKPVTDAVNKILSQPIFKNSNLVTFHATRRG